MSADQKGIEDTWEMLLSREPNQIMAAFDPLSSDQRSAVLEHLEKMVNEPGWQPEQRISAQSALDVIPRKQGKFTQSKMHDRD